ncbi:MAG: PAS domain-containing protein [Chlorobi bacterium]|nr:PAS domain-containing protein [Chlorobiota bacterium]
MKKDHSPVAIVTAFIILGTVWIVTTSIVEHFIKFDRSILILLGPLNAAVFIITAALLMFRLIGKAQKKLRDSQGQLSQSRLQLLEVLENVPIILMAANKDGVITVSKGTGPYSVGERLEEIVGRTIDEIFKDSKEIRGDFERAFRGESFQEVRSWADHVFQCYYRPSYDRDGNVRAVMGVAVDITERVQREREITRAKEEAERANRVRSEFIANLSHEIRTPLNIVAGYATILRMKHGSELGEEEQEIYSTIDEASDRLMNTVEKILDVSRFRSEDFRMELTEVSLTQIFNDLNYEFARIAKKKKLELNIYLPEKEIYVHADQHAMRRALKEILENAVKFTSEGKIEIKAMKTTDDTVEISIEDTGIGIGSVFKEYAFDEFTQEEGGYSRPYEGTGLGLALAKNFIELCGGKIELESEKGKGTKVKIRLPISKESEAASDGQEDQGQHSMQDR